jgi:hypothetical protein
MQIQYGNITSNTRTALSPTSVNSAAVSNTQVAIGNGSVGLVANHQGIVTTNTGGALNLGNRDFTIEFRIYPTSKATGFPNAVYAPLNSATVGGVYGLEVDGTVANKYIFYAPNYTGGSPFSSVLLTSTSNVAYNNWTAVAITRNANTFRMFINGNQESTSTFTGSLDNDNRANVVFGTAGTAGNNYVRGYMDEIRMSNIARYTANYTVATTPFQSDANTTLLLHCDGTVGSTSFPDDNQATIAGAGMTIDYANVSFVNRPAQTTTTNGNVFVSTTDPKIGNGSGSFGGATSITVDNANLVLNNSTEKTMEYWIKTSNSSVRVYLSMGNFANSATTSWWQLYSQSSNRLELGRAGAAVTVSPANTYFANGAWQHFAWTKNGANNSWYVNGNLIHTFTRTESDWLTSSNVMAFGAQNPTNQGLVGNLDEIRVSNVVRYTANFTPQATAFTSDNNTQLLLHCDGANGTTSFPDDNIAIGSGGMTITYV